MTVTVKQLTNIWSWAPGGALHQDILTDRPTVSRQVTLTPTEQNLHYLTPRLKKRQSQRDFDLADFQLVKRQPTWIAWESSSCLWLRHGDSLVTQRNLIRLPFETVKPLREDWWRQQTEQCNCTQQCEIAIAIELLVVTGCKGSINPSTNSDPSVITL
jgi:hypothetical protein